MALAFSDMALPSDMALHEYVYEGDLFWGAMFSILCPERVLLDQQYRRYLDRLQIRRPLPMLQNGEYMIFLAIQNKNRLAAILHTFIPAVPMDVIDIVGVFAMGQYPRYGVYQYGKGDMGDRYEPLWKRFVYSLSNPFYLSLTGFVCLRVCHM